MRDGTGTVPYDDIVNPACRGDPLWSPGQLLPFLLHLRVFIDLIILSKIF